MSSGIYLIKNVANGFNYVGQSVDMEKRKNAHFYALKNDTHWNYGMKRDYKKYGINSFEYFVLEFCSTEMLDIRESAWISYYDSCNHAKGYNNETGGNAKKKATAQARLNMRMAHLGQAPAMKGKHYSEEKKKKMVAHCRKIAASSEIRKKISAGVTKALLEKYANGWVAQKNRVWTPEQRNALAEMRKSTPIKESTRQKLREALFRRWTPEKRKEMSDRLRKLYADKKTKGDKP